MISESASIERLRDDALLLQMIVVDLHRLGGRRLLLHDQPHAAHDLDGGFREIDLAAEQGDAGAMPLGLRHELEGVARRAGRAAEDADDQVLADRRRRAPPWRAGRCMPSSGRAADPALATPARQRDIASFR